MRHFASESGGQGKVGPVGEGPEGGDRINIEPLGSRISVRWGDAALHSPSIASEYSDNRVSRGVRPFLSICIVTNGENSMNNSLSITWGAPLRGEAARCREDPNQVECDSQMQPSEFSSSKL